MDNNNWRPTQGTEPNMDTSDWRAQLPPESRQRIVNKMYVPFFFWPFVAYQNKNKISIIDFFSKQYFHEVSEYRDDF